MAKYFVLFVLLVLSVVLIVLVSPHFIVLLGISPAVVDLIRAYEHRKSSQAYKQDVLSALLIILAVLIAYVVAFYFI